MIETLGVGRGSATEKSDAGRQGVMGSGQVYGPTVEAGTRAAGAVAARTGRDRKD